MGRPDPRNHGGDPMTTNTWRDSAYDVVIVGGGLAGQLGVHALAARAPSPKVAETISLSGMGGRPNTKALAAALLRVVGPHRRHFIVHRLRGLVSEIADVFPAGSELGRLREQILALGESDV